MPPRFRARAGAHLSHAAAQVVGERLEKIIKPGVPLTAEMVLEEASRKQSPLRPFFEWDDKKAAHEHRLDQARTLVRSITIVVKHNGKEEETRAFHFVNTGSNREPERGYMSAMVVFNNDQLTEQVVMAADANLRGWLSRYEKYNALGQAATHVRRALEELPNSKTDKKHEAA